MAKQLYNYLTSNFSKLTVDDLLSLKNNDNYIYSGDIDELIDTLVEIKLDKEFVKEALRSLFFLCKHAYDKKRVVKFFCLW
jgi:hypothetical protein